VTLGLKPRISPEILGQIEEKFLGSLIGSIQPSHATVPLNCMTTNLVLSLFHAQTRMGGGGGGVNDIISKICGKSLYHVCRGQLAQHLLAERTGDGWQI
jgi:hypothetical protein